MSDFQVTKDWILAGKAIFTIFWTKDGEEHHYTYKIQKSEKNGKFDETYFVYLLTGPDNGSDYTYVGLLVNNPAQVITTRKSAYNHDSLPVRALNRAMLRVWDNQPFPENTGIKGEGRCGVCGKRLTRPEGLADDGYRLGYGPVCWKAIQQGK